MSRRSNLRLSITFTVCASLMGLASIASAQSLGTFLWQIAPYCNVVRLSVAIDGEAIRLTGFDDQCGGAQLPAAGSAIARADGLYAISFYVVTANGLVSHLTAAVSPTSLSGPWSDSSGATGTFAFTPPLPTVGSQRPPPRVPGATISTASITDDQLVDAVIETEKLAPSSVTGAKLRLPMSASVNSSGAALQLSNTGAGDAIRGNAEALGGIGISGSGETGVKGLSGHAYGVHGYAHSNAIGVYGWSTGVGPALRLLGGSGPTAIIESTGASNTNHVVVINGAGGGNLLQASSAGLPRFRVTSSGAVQADGAYTSPAADVAEFIDTDETLTPGDVVEIDPSGTGRFRRTTMASARTVAGVVTTKPGVLLRSSSERDEVGDGPAIALAGRVPVKVSAESGPIAAGDLLVASNLPGHAMRAPEMPSPGTVIGKALGPHAGESAGVIDMLVMLR